MLKLRILMKKWPKNIGGIIWIVMILLLLMFIKVDRKSLVSVLGLPNHMTYADFFLVLWFFYPSFIGNANSQGLEDRYSILIRLYDQNSAGSFYKHFNGKQFSSLGYNGSIELSQSFPGSSAEQLSCPVCLGLCASIEGTSPARLADWLGLDSFKGVNWQASKQGFRSGIPTGSFIALNMEFFSPMSIARLVGNVMLSTPSLPKLVRGSMSQELYLLILNQLYDEVRTRKYHQLFHPKQLISGRKMLPTISQRALYRRKFEFLGLMRDFGRAYCQAGKVSQAKIALGVAVKTLGLYKE
ncbi:hypothetical protein OROMI_028837 [Orobanche minor]